MNFKWNVPVFWRCILSAAFSIPAENEDEDVKATVCLAVNAFSICRL